MKKAHSFLRILFLVTLYSCAPAGLAERTDLPLTQATASGDVKITYDRDKISYWSSKYGISFSVPSHLRIWAREFTGKKNPLGEDSLSTNRSRTRILDIRDSSGTHGMFLRFDKKQLTDSEIKDWIDRTIGRFSAAQEYGMPGRSQETKALIDGVNATKADYVWGSGARSLTVGLRTGKGSFFFYARPDNAGELEALLKTIKFVGK